MANPQSLHAFSTKVVAQESQMPAAKIARRALSTNPIAPKRDEQRGWPFGSLKGTLEAPNFVMDKEGVRRGHCLASLRDMTYLDSKMDLCDSKYSTFFLYANN